VREDGPGDDAGKKSDAIREDAPLLPERGGAGPYAGYSSGGAGARPPSDPYDDPPYNAGLRGYEGVGVDPYSDV